MTATMTRRDYLASKGLAIAGARGKFSNAGKEELVRAYAAGMTFLDDESAKPAKATGPVTPKPVAVPRPEVSDYLFPSDFRFPEAEYKAVLVTGKGEHSMREVCNPCGVSLTNHGCNAPTVHGHPVKIVPR